jgi:hypothetical protein
MRENWKAEIPTEKKAAVDRLIISLTETSEEENHSDEWPVTLE